MSFQKELNDMTMSYHEWTNLGLKHYISEDEYAGKDPLAFHIHLPYGMPSWNAGLEN